MIRKISASFFKKNRFLPSGQTTRPGSMAAPETTCAAHHRYPGRTVAYGQADVVRARRRGRAQSQFCGGTVRDGSPPAAPAPPRICHGPPCLKICHKPGRKGSHNFTYLTVDRATPDLQPSRLRVDRLQSGCPVFQDVSQRGAPRVYRGPSDGGAQRSAGAACAGDVGRPHHGLPRLDGRCHARQVQ